MKLKYYLRGLGIGIIVTALLMGYSNRNSNINQAAAKTEQIEIRTEESSQNGLLADRKPQETDTASEEITQTAENDVLENVSEESSATGETVTEATSETEEISTEATSETEEISTETISVIEESPVETTSAVEGKTSDAETAEMEKSLITEEKSAKDNITLNIVRGDDSGTVSRKLQNAGVIDNAAEFDAYLMQHGYDKKISIGTVEIPQDATWLEIAELISGR